jgi:hypothetical protein
MKLLKLSLVTIPLLLFTTVHAQDEDDTALGDSGTGTFESRGSLTPNSLKDQEQLQMQKEEEEETDSFGESEYNQNVDPDAYHVDDEILNEEEEP